MKNFRLLIPVLTVLTFLLSCSNSEKEYIDEEGIFRDPKAISFNDTLKKTFYQLKLNDSSRVTAIQTLSHQFYKKNGFKSRWLYDKKPSKLATNFLSELGRARYYGLNPETYNYAEIKKTIEEYYDEKNGSSEEIELLDKKMTASFLLFLKHLTGGRITPKTYGDKIWKAEKDEKINELSLLLKLKNTEDLEQTLDSVHPNHEYYILLRDHLRKVYNEEEKDIKQFEFEDAKDFKVGFESEKVGMLRNNLAEWGIDVAITDSTKNIVDSSLINSLKLFQKSRSIKQDGLPGENTLLYLNMTKGELVDLIALNLERIRWLPKKFSSDYILVNVPEFMLRIYDEGEVKLKMRVIVGKEYNPTPMFSDTLKYIVFRPTWTVPQSIIQGEMIPKLIKNPNYYTQRDFKIYEGDQEINPKNVNWSKASDRYFTFVQQPSTSNALGLVKFIFPNDMSIYLHDTPNDRLFDNEERALSHGCVRVQYPVELAEYLLKDVEGWDKEKVEEAINEGDTKRVDMKTLYHVQIAYLTTWINEEGNLMIAEDIYGHDERQLKELKQF